MCEDKEKCMPGLIEVESDRQFTLEGINYLGENTTATNKGPDDLNHNTGMG